MFEEMSLLKELLLTENSWDSLALVITMMEINME